MNARFFLAVCLRLCVVGLAQITLLHSPAAEPPAGPAVTALAVTPDGKGFLQGSQSGVVYRSFEGGGRPAAVETKLDHVHALTFSPDGSLLAVAGGSPAESGAVEIWSWAERKLLARLQGHEDVVHDAAWLPKSKVLATASADRTVRLWEADTGRPRATLRGHSGPVLCLAASPDGQWLCTGSGDHTIRVWDPAGGKLVRSLNNHLGPVHALAFRPRQPEDQPALLASASEDGTVRVWQPGIGRMVRIVRQPTPVFCLAWKRDGSQLCTGAKDGVVRFIAGDSDEIVKERKLAAERITSLAAHFHDVRMVIGQVGGKVTVLER